MRKAEEKQPSSGEKEATDAKPVCGIIRPIADFEPYRSGHWSEVHAIMAEAIEFVGYEPRLVSESASSNVIHGTIVTNLYEDPIVVCDVSGRNPNVMFELGLRIAFQKPVIIVADDRTPFSFDISPIKHIQYPHSLRYGDIQKFKDDLKVAIPGTIDAARDPKIRNYLQQFGPIKSIELDAQIITGKQVAEDLREMRQSIRALERASSNANRPVFRQRNRYIESPPIEFTLSDADEQTIGELAKLVLELEGTHSVQIDGNTIKIYPSPGDETPDHNVFVSNLQKAIARNPRLSQCRVEGIVRR